MRLIDADALIEKLDEMQIDTAYSLDNEDVGIARARDVVESFPTASQWISVDERLPELCEQRLLYEDIELVKRAKRLRWLERLNQYAEPEQIKCVDRKQEEEQ